MCEFCGNDKDIIFPFQLSKCQRCEGEPSPLVAGWGSSRAPSPRPSIPLTWRDWKISHPRRLARALSKDRREGEGGEEDADGEMAGGARSRKQEDKERRQERGGLFETFTRGKLVKAFSLHEDSEEEGEGEDKGRVETGEVCSNARREKLNLFKVLHLDRLKKSISRRDSDSETCSSLESLDGAGKGRWKMSGFVSLGFSRGDSGDERKNQVKDQDKCEGRSSEDAGTEDEDEQAEKREGKNGGPPAAVSSRKRSRGEESGSGGSDGRPDMEQDPVQTNWRARKTRKARRVTRGRQRREGGAEGGDGGERGGSEE